MSRIIASVKLAAIAAFLVTLGATYTLRSEVLELNEIRFSADHARAEQRLRDLEASRALRIAEHQAQLQHHEIQETHYAEMLELYRNDYTAYVTRLEDDYRPPPLPTRPQPPKDPALGEQLVEANAAFTAKQHEYFATTQRLNRVGGASGLLLVGCLLALILFDSGYQRALYFATLVLSFTFMIGPSFHSLLSAVVGVLEAPKLF
jgi:hypothetical protein